MSEMLIVAVVTLFVILMVLLSERAHLAEALRFETERKQFWQDQFEKYLYIVVREKP